MTDTWIVAANSARATIFRAAAPTAPLAEIASFQHPEARQKEAALTSDRPGRSFDSKGEGRHAMSSEVEPKTQEQIRFAKSVAEHLEQGRTSHAFGRLVLVAAPAFLGHLRAHFGAPLRACIALEVDKDYTALRADELRARLPAQL